MAESAKKSKEIFRAVKGFESYYVSNFGNVKQIRLYKTGRFKEKKLTIDSRLISVRLVTTDGLIKSFKVAKLVAEAFLTEPADGRRRVIHLDSNPLNCNASNLAWAGLSYTNVYEIRKLIADGQTMNSVAIKYGIKPVHVRRIVEGFAWNSISG